MQTTRHRPLNAILGYTELILDSIYGEMPEKARAVLERLQANGRHLLGLINDVLDLSKIEAGQLTLSLDNYSLSDMVHGVVSAVEPLAAEKRLTFKAEVAPGLPTGRGDERRLSQVLLNLVGNAIKFTDKGEVAIRASVTNGAFTVAVCDTGSGNAGMMGARGMVLFFIERFLVCPAFKPFSARQDLECIVPAAD
jgi:signal transduction histidine kinase